MTFCWGVSPRYLSLFTFEYSVKSPAPELKGRTNGYTLPQVVTFLSFPEDHAINFSVCEVHTKLAAKAMETQNHNNVMCRAISSLNAYAFFLGLWPFSYQPLPACKFDQFLSYIMLSRVKHEINPLKTFPNS